MGARVTITARQARLGLELRRLREAAGMSVREAARGLGINETKISHVEAGRSGVGAERLRAMAAHYACLDDTYVDALVEMTGERPRRWWESYRGTLGQPALDLAELEHDARALRTLQVNYIPGLLQTESYTRAVFSYGVPEPTPKLLDTVVSFRLRRQKVLDDEPAPPFDAVIHEAALRILVGDRAVARHQLDHLLGQSERPNVTVRVIPFAAENFAGSGHSMLHAVGWVPRLDTIEVGGLPGATWLDAEAQLAKYRALLNKAADVALPAAASRDLIRDVARDL
ncbi:helix-turn-helix transcriptional regulator [Streptomyces sp. NPDC127098]|uniref:helix-turn-helix domain-containing protein n=1 Tax=Streptomyces sp. NPDC127098 TaxID=3347137 RepID=UPI003659069C